MTTQLDGINQQRDYSYASYETAGESPHRTIAQRRGSSVHMMTEIDDNVFVAWEQCSTCLRNVNQCACVGGPAEPAHVARWRSERAERKSASVAVRGQVSPSSNVPGGPPGSRGIELLTDSAPTFEDNAAAPTADEVNAGIEKAMMELRRHADRDLGSEDVGF